MDWIEEIMGFVGHASHFEDELQESEAKSPWYSQLRRNEFQNSRSELGKFASLYVFYFILSLYFIFIILIIFADN